MRTIILASLLPLAGTLAAQCTFTPTISPSAPIMCPGEVTTLSTQEYDSYQWYKDGQPVPGAMAQTLEVSYFNDSGSSFSVMATDDGCSEMSSQVLVDGWVFLPPAVMHEGDEPISIGPFGEPTYCEGALVQLTLMMPYTESIQWTNNGLPIPGANASTLVVTEAGSYSVSGAPAVCPNSISNLGLTIDVAFMDSIQPTIMTVDEQICAEPTGSFYQWYLNGEAIINSNTPCITTEAPGVYTVYVDYEHGCQTPSAPYLSTGVADLATERPWSLYPSPSNGLVTVTWKGATPTGTFWSVTDTEGREIRSGFMPTNGPLQLDLGDLVKGTYLFQAAHKHKALAPATRFTLVH